MSDPLADTRTTIARRDLASLTREKTIVLALLIQLFIAAFSSFLVVGLTSLYDPGAVQSGGTEVGVTGEAREELLVAAQSVDGVETEAYEDPRVARQQFRNGQVSALLTAERTPASDGGTTIDVTATVPDSSIRTTLIVVQVRSLLTALERTERTDRARFLSFQPRPLPAESDASPYFGFTYTILVPLLLFLPAFISGSVAVDSLTEEIERGTLELLRVAPVSLVDIVDGKSAAMILLAPAQAAVWLLLLSLNSISIANVVPVLVLVTAVATLLVVLGVTLGLVAQRRRQAQLLYSVLAILVFGGTALLPEHPATTVAKLTVGSPTLVTFAHVAGFAVVAALAYAAVRTYSGRLRPESLA